MDNYPTEFTDLQKRPNDELAGRCLDSNIMALMKMRKGKIFGQEYYAQNIFIVSVLLYAHMFVCL